MLKMTASIGHPLPTRAPVGQLVAEMWSKSNVADPPVDLFV